MLYLNKITTKRGYDMISIALAILQSDEQRNILSEFYEEHKNQFYSLAYSKLHNSEESEDALQETFLRIVKYPDRFFSIEPHKRLPYAIIIIRNVVLRILEQKGKYQFEELTEEISDSQPSIEEISIGNVAYDELVEFIKSLSEAKKQALILKGMYGLSNREIADVLGITESAVRRRIPDAYGIIINFIRKDER